MHIAVPQIKNDSVRYTAASIIVALRIATANASVCTVIRAFSTGSLRGTSSNFLQLRQTSLCVGEFVLRSEKCFNFFAGLADPDSAIWFRKSLCVIDAGSFADRLALRVKGHTD